MSLDKQLETLEEEHARLVIEIKENESSLSNLQIRQEELESEIMETKRTLLLKSGGLNLKDKFRLKEDLDQIGHMLSGLREAYSMNLALVDCEVEDAYKISVSGQLSDCKVTICTKSELVKSIVRKCFTQKAHCYGEEESELEKTTRNEWYEGPYSCCSRSFKYNVEQTKELYNDENEEQKKMYDNWIRSGKRW